MTEPRKVDTRVIYSPIGEDSSTVVRLLSTTNRTARIRLLDQTEKVVLLAELTPLADGPR